MQSLAQTCNLTKVLRKECQIQAMIGWALKYSYPEQV